MSSYFAECEKELQKAIPEAQLRGHSVGDALRHDGPLRSSTLPTAAGSSDTMAVGTSSVRTLVHEGKGPTEHEDEEDDDEDDNEDEDEEDDYDEIGMSQLGGAPFPSQFKDQVLQTTFRHTRD